MGRVDKRSGDKGELEEGEVGRSDGQEREGLAELADLEGYYRQLEGVLLAIGYLYPHTAGSRMAKIRRLLNRAYPSGAEVALLRGMLRQMEWALKQRS
jgi:tRNA/rRNA methyltransferase